MSAHHPRYAPSTAKERLVLLISEKTCLEMSPPRRYGINGDGVALFGVQHGCMMARVSPQRIEAVRVGGLAATGSGGLGTLAGPDPSSGSYTKSCGNV
jgi:hypothetical protein